MDTQAAITKAQHAIIDGLVACETAIAELYRTYSGVFPDHTTFWNRIARDEETHAKLLQGLHAYLDRGHVFFNIGKFGGENIRSIREKIAGYVAAAKAGRVTFQDALFAASATENALLDSKFYATVTSQAPEYQRVAEVLTQSTERHASAIQAKLHETISAAKSAKSR